MRRSVCLVLAAMMALLLTGCGKNPIEGTWQYVSGDSDATGKWNVPYTMTFQKGKLTIDLDFSKTGLSESDAAFDRQMASTASLTYQIVSGTEIKITITQTNLNYSKTETFSYKVNGNQLTLDGATYTRK